MNFNENQALLAATKWGVLLLLVVLFFKWLLPALQDWSKNREKGFPLATSLMWATLAMTGGWLFSYEASTREVSGTSNPLEELTRERIKREQSEREPVEIVEEQYIGEASDQAAVASEEQRQSAIERFKKLPNAKKGDGE